MSDNSGMSLGATSSGESRQQIIENRANANELQATLFKKGGYTCPTTSTNTTQNNIMDKVCQGNASANQVNEGTKMGGKTKRKRKKTKRRKLKKKSKRRK
jgi:hypothetical protein